MWFWILSNILGSILGAASTKYLKNTKIGKWAIKKVDHIAARFSEKHDINILDTEEIGWRRKFPTIAKKMDALEERIAQLEK